MNAKSIEKIESQLFQQREKTLKRIARLESGLGMSDQGPAEYLEKVKKEVSTQFITILDKRKFAALKEISQALSRIENGTYGICDVCGKSISIKRLNFLPATTLCRKCARKRGLLRKLSTYGWEESEIRALTQMSSSSVSENRTSQK
jgi:RNA polymerase-binding transcription factor DksA